MNFFTGLSFLFLLCFSSPTYGYHKNYGPEIEVDDLIATASDKDECFALLVDQLFSKTQYADLKFSKPQTGWWFYSLDGSDSHGNAFKVKMSAQYGLNYSYEVGNPRDGFVTVTRHDRCQFNRAHTSGPSKKGCEYSLQLFNAKDQLVLAAVRGCY